MISRIRTALALFLVGLGAILVSGCGVSPRYEVAVSALVAPGGDAIRHYVLVPGNQGVNLDDLQFKEFAEYINRAMELQGYAKAAPPESADLIVVAVYSISDPQTQTYTYAIPHWGQTGIATSTTYGTANTYGTLNTYGNYGRYSGTTSYSGTTYYQPTYGITGFSTGIGQYTTYTRMLMLVGFDAAPIRTGGDQKELWRVSATSTGASGDLRLIFPYLVAAARPYIGKPTDRAITVLFSENDTRVTEIRPVSTPTEQAQK